VFVLRDPVMRAACVLVFVGFVLAPAAAQDIRGLENCTAEKQMERRTGCLQANAEFLHQEIRKQATESRHKLTAAEKEIATAKSELATAHKDIAALKETIGKMQAKLDELEKAKKDGK
jgi:septal ring factor EnvC (AmiA/AmiB activator)